MHKMNCNLRFKNMHTFFVLQYFYKTNLFNSSVIARSTISIIINKPNAGPKVAPNDPAQS